MMSIQISIFLPRYLRVNITDVGLHREMRIAHLPFHYIKPCLCQRLLLIHVLEGLHRITFHFLSFKINLRSSEFLVNGQRQFKAGEIIMTDKIYNIMYIQSRTINSFITTDKILIFNFFLMWIILIGKTEPSVPKGKVICSHFCVPISIIAIWSVFCVTTG